MIFISARSGKPAKLKHATKYLIKWNGKCRSKIQARVKELLYPHWFADVVFEEFPVLGTRLTLDFFNSNRQIALEVDGNQHYQYNKFFHGGSRMKFLQQLQRDQMKEDFCERNGITLIRIMESEKIDQKLLKELKLI
jgi:very-short-patch-repair endonuclease